MFNTLTDGRLVKSERAHQRSDVIEPGSASGASLCGCGGDVASGRIEVPPGGSPCALGENQRAGAPRCGVARCPKVDGETTQVRKDQKIILRCSIINRDRMD